MTLLARDAAGRTNGRPASSTRNEPLERLA